MAEALNPANAGPLTARSRQADMMTFILCFAASLVEGFDLQSAGVAAPKFAPLYQLTPSQLGWVFSANTFGLFLGAALGGWVSDRFGRKLVLVASMLLFGVFSLATAMAPNAEMLIVMRFLTGLGLGGAMPNLIAMTAETGGAANRATKVTMITAGMPLGGSFASLLALFGGAQLDWRVIFYVGGVAPLVVGIAMLFLLQESHGYLESRHRAASGAVHDKSTYRALFGEGRGPRTLLLWAGFFFTLVVLYLMLNWMPTLLIGKGFAKSDATLGTLLFAFGGAVGAIALGFLMSKGGRRTIVTVSYAGMAVALFAMAGVTKDLPVMLAAAFGIGFFVIGAQYLLYGLSPTFYPSAIRGTGVGWGVAVGRLGSVAGPAAAAAILSSGGGPTEVMMAMLPVIAIAFVAVLAMTWKAAPEVD